MTTNPISPLFVSFSLAFFSALLFPTDSAEAVGMGKLTVYSTLGKPLMAEVELTDAPLNDQPLMECFRLGSEGNNASLAPLIAHGRVTLEQSSGRYRLHISSEQPVNDSPVQLSLRKGCGAEVTKNYLFSVPAGGNRQFAANDRPLRLPRARQFDVPLEVAPGGPATREWQLARKTTARDLARKRHPGNPAAQARYLRALQAANPDVDLGSRGQNRLPANTWLSIPGKPPRFAGQSTAAVRAKPSPDKSASAPIAPPPPKKADRVIVSSGQPGNDNPATPTQRPVIDVAAGTVHQMKDDEARLLAAVDLQFEQQRLLSEKIRLLDERIQELQKAAAPATPSQPSAASASAAEPSAALPTASVPAPSVTTAVTATVGVPAAPSTAAPDAAGLPATMAPKAPPKPRMTSRLWGEWGNELLFGALVLAVGTLLFVRSRSHRAVPIPATTTQPVVSEIPSQAAPETISRWQLVDEGENLSVFDPAPTATDKSGNIAAEHSASSAYSPGVHDEMTAVLELAEIMVSFGRLAGAAQAIEEFIDKHPLIAVTPWLKLLEIYRQNGQREAFAALAVRLQKHFNVAPAEWDSMDENPLSPLSPSDAEAIPIDQLLARLPTLGQLPHIQAEISRTWATPACASYIDKLLRDNRNGERRGFLLGTVRELLLITDVLDSALKRS